MLHLEPPGLDACHLGGHHSRAASTGTHPDDPCVHDARVPAREARWPGTPWAASALPCWQGRQPGNTMHRMRPSLLLCSLLLCLGCARSVEPVNRPEDAASASAMDASVNPPAPARDTAAPDAAAPASSSAAEAPSTSTPEAHDAGAQPRPAASNERPAPPGAECRSDDDCTLTLVPEGECCARLCTGRAVTATEAQAIDARVSACEERGRPCAIPSCAPPRMRPMAVCTGGRCGIRNVVRERP